MIHLFKKPYRNNTKIILDVCTCLTPHYAKHTSVPTAVKTQTSWGGIASAAGPVQEGYHGTRSDGKRPDGMTMTPWSQGKFLVWDATCTDTLCASNLQRSATEAGAAAAHAETLKKNKYADLGSSYIFAPIAVETYRSLGPQARFFLRNLATD